MRHTKAIINSAASTKALKSKLYIKNVYVLCEGTTGGNFSNRNLILF